jgi:serine/threonine-protein kinase
MQPVDERGREISRLLEGRYEVLGLLGRGGFATVYQVRNLRLQRLEALKVVAGSHEESSDFLRRFEQESRVAASLEHPNILKVYDFGHVGGILWYSMPFVDGPTLTVELGRRGTFEEAAAARIVVPLLDALEYSHGRGVIHRDIKLDNILLDRRDRPFLMDFGIAKTDDSLVKTQTGFVLGSPAYISPEQLRGERLDGRTDVYSLGVSLFQMVAGTVPFKSERMADLAERLVGDAPRLSARKPGVSPGLDRIVARALARLRDDRYPGAREMRQDLEAFLEGLRTPPAAPAPDPASLEDTATLSAAKMPSIAIPAPPPVPAQPAPAPPRARRVSAVVPVPAAPPPRPSTPPAGLSRSPALAVAVAAGLLAIAAAFFLTRRGAPPEPDARPAPPARPTAAAPAPVPTQAPAPPAAPAPTPQASLEVSTPAPVATQGAPVRPAPARPSPDRASGSASVRRVVTRPEVLTPAPVTLSPEQERACGGQFVGVSILVGADGVLKSKRVISSVSPLCDALALDVLSRSTFRPARDDRGDAVELRFVFAVPL